MIALDFAWTHARFGHLSRTLLRYARARHASPSSAVESAEGHDLTQAAPVQDLHERCAHQLRGGAARLRVDLTGVTAVDSKLVASLVALSRAARRNGQAVEVVPSEAVLRWVRICRVEGLLASAN